MMQCTEILWVDYHHRCLIITNIDHTTGISRPRLKKNIKKVTGCLGYLDCIVRYNIKG